MTPGTLVSVNVGRPREVDWRGRRVRTAIWKEPVTGPVRVDGVNLVGDDQADRRVHGGPDKAVYAYAVEDYAWWSDELGREVGPATFGDNLTLAGVDVTGALVGEVWQVGGVRLEVCQPRTPCYKLGIRMGDDRFTRRFLLAARPGAYLRILEPGSVRAGDPVVVAHRPDHDVTVAAVSRAYHGRDRRVAAQMLEIPALAAGWRDWASELVA